MKDRVIEEKIFEKEVAICRKLSKQNGGRCNWGECDKCGVILLLYKLGKGEFYEDDDEIKRIKKDMLQ
jgi:hypothetical protein